MDLRVAHFRSPGALVDFVNNAVEVQSATVVAGGTEYAVDDILTVIGGNGFSAVLKVTVAPGGVIAAVPVEVEGAYTTAPSNPVSVSGGSGNNDATFNLTTIAAIQKADIGRIQNKKGTWYLLYWA